MPNLTLKCKKTCNDNMCGFCRNMQARDCYSEIFDENHIKNPEKRIIDKCDDCKFQNLEN